jgi:hypothetical protein
MKYPSTVYIAAALWLIGAAAFVIVVVALILEVNNL